MRLSKRLRQHITLRVLIYVKILDLFEGGVKRVSVWSETKLKLEDDEASHIH